MLKIIFIILPTVLTFSACTPSKTQNSTPKITQGVEGFVYKISGNQMPMPGITPPKPNGIATFIYIYEQTNIKDVVRIEYSPYYRAINKNLITTIQSDSTGHFIVQLPVGSYSFFTKIGDLYYANLFDTENNIALIKVNEGKITETVINIDAGATY